MFALCGGVGISYISAIPLAAGLPSEPDLVEFLAIY
jgi:hypothetical protein